MKQRRKTRQRQLVLDAVQARCDHPSAEQIYQDVRAVDENISRGTVYRNLNILTQGGDILQVKLPHSDRFDRRLDLHYHLLCTGCGAVVESQIPYRAELDRSAAEGTGFAVARHQTVFEGLCPACQKKAGCGGAPPAEEKLNNREG